MTRQLPGADREGNGVLKASPAPMPKLVPERDKQDQRRMPV